MTVTFEVTVWSKNLTHRAAAYRAGQNGSLSKHFFFLLRLCVQTIRDKKLYYSCFPLLLTELSRCTSHYLCPLRSISLQTTFPRLICQITSRWIWNIWGTSEGIKWQQKGGIQGISVPCSGGYILAVPESPLVFQLPSFLLDTSSCFCSSSQKVPT